MKPKVTDFSQLDLSKTYTYADYLTWQFNERGELIKGWIYKMSQAPKRIHQEVEGKLFLQIGNFINFKSCKVYHSPFDVRLLKNKGQSNEESETLEQPDICMLCDLEKLDDRGCVGAPDLIIEVLSPLTTKKDYYERFNLYQEKGVEECRLVNPERKSIQIFYLENNAYVELETFLEKKETLRSKLFPKLSFPMTSIFEY